MRTYADGDQLFTTAVLKSEAECRLLDVSEQGGPCMQCVTPELSSPPSFIHSTTRSSGS